MLVDDTPHLENQDIILFPRNYFVKTIWFFLSLMILSVSFTISFEKAFAQNSIGIFSIDSEIFPTDSILISGYVNTDSSSDSLILEVYDPKGTLLYNPEVSFDDRGYFSWVFYPPKGQFDTLGEYTVTAIHEDLDEHAQLYFTVIQKNPSSPKDVLITPQSEIISLDALAAITVGVIVIGVVIWMRMTYQDKSISKKSIN